MLDELSLKAPAKINLSLKVLGKREDGFHELETLMVPVRELADTLSFKRAEQFHFTCNAEGVPTDERNLVVRAVRAFEQETGAGVNYEISLEKKIPHGAGLGGGSSDAATALLGLNQLYGFPLSVEVLHELAARLGSDVPFFLYGGACVCRGRGERIERIRERSPFPVVLLKPAFSVSTPDAFSRWGTAREVEGFSYGRQAGPYGEMVNDLERPVFEKFLFLGELKKWLLVQPEVRQAQMSGSGSTMIALLRDLKEASSLVERALEVWDPHLFSWAGMVD